MPDGIEKFDAVAHNRAEPNEQIANSTLEELARRNARAGTFLPPSLRQQWPQVDDAEFRALEKYSRAYFSEWEEMRFQAGNYELL